MKIETVDGIDWPVLQPEDCHTRIGDDVFALFEDESGNGVFGYGHVPEAEFLAEVRRFWACTCPDDDEWEIVGPVSHVWAKFIDPNGERFSWAGATSETQHAFPMTVLEW
ncbi:hypothetical protein FHT44_004985 [Mycolicibacterium sp. BK634]|uniref:hypothetical protein n=1 Tax=Mycolicibacterium sp. BK634 TaxID=2587099 RepID=UPI00160E0787|nr:hypothetical protein [Mycolicibacterium sp. BK634]MBB3752473.1 hypothetical protein [Mycolicibacterium sp. BK634]